MWKAARCPHQSTPYNLVLRLPARTLFFSDASIHDAVGYLLETGFWWQYTCDEDERDLFRGNSIVVTGENDLCLYCCTWYNFSVAEMLGMVMSALIFVNSRGERPVNTRYTLARSPHCAAITKAPSDR